MAQCLPKGDKFENIIQKTTELGVASIIPVISKNTDVKIKPEKIEAKLERWQKIARQACMQCGRPNIPQIQKPINLNEVHKVSSNEKIVLWEKEKNMTLKNYLNGERVWSGDISKDFVILIGPEGGFAQDEIKQLKKQGIVPISIGKSVLRTETAAIAVLSMLNFLLSIISENYATIALKLRYLNGKEK